MGRLVCVFVVRKLSKTGFLQLRLIVYAKKTLTKYACSTFKFCGIKSLVFVLNFGVQAVESLVVAYLMSAKISKLNVEQQWCRYQDQFGR